MSTIIPRREIHDPQGGLSREQFQASWDRCHTIEKRLLEAECVLAQERARVTESQEAATREWVLIKATQDETEEREQQSWVLYWWSVAFFVTGLLWFLLMTLQAMHRLPGVG